MDATAQRLLGVLRDLEREQWRIGHRIAAVRTALSLAGVEPPSAAVADENEERYARQHLFAGQRLIDGCERIVKDHQGEWLVKRRVAYLLERGGYTSGAKVLVNSVECTLRRLASLGRIEMRRNRGPHGNQYRSVPAGWVGPKPGPKPQAKPDHAEPRPDDESRNESPA
ncbi:MAG TPA: hypothetical protein VIX19_20675 [Terriglobales bacterium]